MAAVSGKFGVFGVVSACSRYVLGVLEWGGLFLCIGCRRLLLLLGASVLLLRRRVVPCTPASKVSRFDLLLNHVRASVVHTAS